LRHGAQKGRQVFLRLRVCLGRRMCLLACVRWLQAEVVLEKRVI
jgi:hypothetical protein